MRVRLRHSYGQWLASGGYLMLLLVGIQLESAIAWQVCAGATALLALVAWIMALRRARAIADTPTSTIASAAQGYVELYGRGVPIGGTPLVTPFLGLTCLWYRYKIERKQDDKWVVESHGESSDSFLVDDGSGTCLVDPEGAEILPRSSETWQKGDHRYTQAVLFPGEPIYALGHFRTLSGAGEVFDLNEDVKHLLAEWKKDLPQLLERFDLDQDGTIDLREWQLARSQARREVTRNHRELRAAPDTHLLGRPPDGRLFLISSLPPAKLRLRYARWAVAHLVFFFAALAVLVHFQPWT